jgi:serine protease
MSREENGLDRRSLLKTTGGVAAAAAVGGLAGTASADGCEDVVETVSWRGETSDEVVYTYDIATGEPCSVDLTVEWDDEFDDFDLYVTYDGTTPDTGVFGNYDQESTSMADGIEEMRIDGDDVADSESIGILVEAFSGGGEFTVTVEERARRSQEPLRIRNVHAEPGEMNATGDRLVEVGQSADEWVEECVLIENPGDGPVSLGGYTIEDGAGNAFEFDDWLLRGGWSIRLFTGHGEPTRWGRHRLVDTYWERADSVWNDSGDTATLRDPDGRVVDHVVYGSHEPGIGIRHVRPRGDDEAIVVENTGGVRRGIAGLTVEDEADNDFQFSRGAIEPGWTITLYTGDGESGWDRPNDDYELYRGRSAVWNDDGDTAVLRNDRGEVIDRLSYGKEGELAVQAVLPDREYESIVFENVGDAAMEVTDYSVADAAGHSIDLSAERLAPGETLELFTRDLGDLEEYSDADHVHWWGREQSVWNDSGDVAVLRNPDGEFVDRLEYDGEGDLVIDTVHPEGTDESVVLENVGGATLNLKDYWIQDAAGHDDEFTLAHHVAPGERVTVFTRSFDEDRVPEHDGDSWYMLGRGASIWNDGGDTATLRTPDGRFADHYEY